MDTVFWRACGSSQLAWSKGRRPPGAPFLYSSREPSELSQWLCHDDWWQHYTYCRGYYYYSYSFTYSFLLRSNWLSCWRRKNARRKGDVDFSRFSERDVTSLGLEYVHSTSVYKWTHQLNISAMLTAKCVYILAEILPNHSAECDSDNSADFYSNKLTFCSSKWHKSKFKVQFLQPNCWSLH